MSHHLITLLSFLSNLSLFYFILFLYFHFHFIVWCLVYNNDDDDDVQKLSLVLLSV